MNWTEFFLKEALFVAQKSKDPNTKVGAVLTSPTHRHVSQGYNGFPQRIRDTAERLSSRDGLKQQLTLHAEINCLLFADSDRIPGSTLYVTAPPCVRCAVQIIQCGVAKVICLEASEEMQERWGDQIKLAKELFQEAEIIYLEYPRYE